MPISIWPNTTAKGLLELVIELTLVLLCSGVIGFEREQKSRPAGLRTHMIVATTAMLIMHIGGLLGETYMSLDPTRMAAQVVSGIGFLGAGTILRNRTKDEVHGLTTAATLWAVAAVGIAIGAGYWIEGIIATFALILVLSIASRFESRFSKKRSFEFVLDIKGSVKEVELLQFMLVSNDYELEDYAVQGHEIDEDGKTHLVIFVRIKTKVKSRVNVPQIPLGDLLQRYSFVRVMSAL